MLRTQAIGVKNAKKSQTSSSNANVNKTKGAKSASGDKKSRASVSETGKSAIKSVPIIKVQGQNRFENVTHNMQPNSSRSNQFVDYADRTFERSNSFFLTRKLSKLYDSLTTNSKESLKDNKNDSDSNANAKPATPFKFIRSVSLAAISLKKDYRNSMRKPKLEQLSEEDHPSGVTIEKLERKYEKKSKTASVDSLSSRTSEKSSSMISSFKRTFSLTPSRRNRKSSNPKWSASLQSLQQIDVMISYEDLSFIDYDKFNTYEENLMNKIKSSNQTNDVAYRSSTERLPVRMRPRSTNDMAQQRRHSTIYQQTVPTDGDNNTSNWLNGDSSKRWSNPCIIANTEYTSFPSYASVVKVQSPSIGADECDSSASTNCLDETDSMPMPMLTTIIPAMATTKVAHSVDDLTGESNENTDLLLETVSG